MHIAAYEKARDQAKAAQAALLKIVQAQRTLEDHKNDLTGAQLKVLLTRYESYIRGVTALLSPTSSSSRSGGTDT